MIPRPEHPRPDLERSAWQNLNGRWHFAFDPEDVGVEQRWFERDSLARRITVPFPVESELSGIGNTNPPEVCWYLRTFDLGRDLEAMEERIILHFGAVDYRATVWLNGERLGEHTGGYTPFSFDVTGAVKDKNNLLALRVFDSKDRMQARGKQTPKDESYLIMYTKVTGIWQTVWIERVGDPYLKSYRFTPSPRLDGGTFTLEVSDPEKGVSAEIEIVEMGKPLAGAQSLEVVAGRAEWKCENPRTWSPDSPDLYRVVILLRDSAGLVRDRVESYVGIRTIEAKGGRVYLNGEDFYQKLLLDQGYFPGGIYTAADDGVMKADCEMYKRMGFNGLRKHQKVEDPRFLYWCDRLGLVVWEEMPSLGFGIPRPVPGPAMEQFTEEWIEVIERDFNHPCIITWAPFNETWGIYSMLTRIKTRQWARDTVRRTREADPTRLVCDNSGGWHFDTDLWDFHHYLATAESSRKLYQKYAFREGDHLGFAWYTGQIITGKLLLPIFFPGVDYQGQPVILSEYGGFGYYPVLGKKGLLELYRDYTLVIGEFDYIRGYCYTQPYDVEQEKNGLMSFERKPKVDPEEIKKINDMMGRD